MDLTSHVSYITMLFYKDVHIYMNGDKDDYMTHLDLCNFHSY